MKDMIARFEIFQDQRRNWKFRLKAANGVTIAISKSYLFKRNAELGVQAVRKYANNSIILYK